MEARQETGSRTANHPIADILRPESSRLVGCWNVRTLYQTGKLAQVLKKMESYGISLLGVSKARRTGFGKRQLASGQTIAFSVRSDDQHDQGVALIIDQEGHKTLIEWKPINERLMSARFNSAYAKLTTVVCYASTEVAEDTEKDAFYDQLQKVI
ncbi:uncharacterized protein LOC127872060 [Dreissena polymorpha]|uniref:uncharacterized protein LOC127872060 n=1 Tax=Dreissena polymorpha TaxID=45954 RepID=UPI002263C9A1|nr:uncharacterized protein LOC127872060 [Dreissena polymorpha]